MTNTCRSNEHEQRRPASSSNTGSSADDNANLEGTENDADMQAEDGSTPNAAADQQANPPHPPPPRQSIRFAPSSSTRHVPSLHDLDDDVLQALYYDEDENSGMLLDVVRNITAMRRHQQEQQQPQAPQQQGLNRSEGANANPPVEGDGEGEEMQGEEEEEYCFRGLEHMRDNTVMQMRQHARDQVIDDVLDEQERQRADEDDGIAPPSPERLAAVSRAGSVSARNRGIVMGILDEAAVRRDRDADGEEEEEGPSQQGRPRQGGAGDADNPDNRYNNRRDEDGDDGGGGGGGGNGRETLVGLLGAAGRMGLE